MRSSVLVSLRVKASPERAFAAFTDEIGQWWRPNQLFAFTPPAPGTLAFTWRQATFRPGQETQVEVRFEPVGEETRVSVEHRGWESVPQDHVARHRFPDGVFLRRHGEWWQALLASFRHRLGAPR